MDGSRTSSRNWQPRTPGSAAAAGAAPPHPSARASESRGSVPAPRAAPTAPPSAAAPEETWPPSDQSLRACARTAPGPGALRRSSAIDLSKDDVLGTDHGHHIGQHVSANHLPESGQMHEARSTALDAVRLVGAVRDQEYAEFALRRLDRGIGLALGHAVAFGHEFEMVNQRLHVALHVLAARGAHLAVVDHHRPGIGAQPVHALADDAVGLAHLSHAHQVAVVAIAIDPDRYVEIERRIHLVRPLAPQIPLDARTAQHRTGKAELQCALGRYHADVDGALLPDAIVGQQRFVLIHPPREFLGEGLDEIQQRAGARRIETLALLLGTPARG